MSTRNHTTDRDAAEAAGRLPEGIASFEIEDGGLVVYDRDDHRAWLQSDDPVSLTEVR